MDTKIDEEVINPQHYSNYRIEPAEYIMLNDMELIGIPYLIIVGDRSLDQGLIELKNRHTQEKTSMTVDQVIQFFSSSAAR